MKLSSSKIDSKAAKSKKSKKLVNDQSARDRVKRDKDMALDKSNEPPVVAPTTHANPQHDSSTAGDAAKEDRQQMPVKVRNGSPSYMNLLDALNAWQLARELSDALG